MDGRGEWRSRFLIGWKSEWGRGLGLRGSSPHEERQERHGEALLMRRGRSRGLVVMGGVSGIFEA